MAAFDRQPPAPGEEREHTRRRNDLARYGNRNRLDNIVKLAADLLYTAPQDLDRHAYLLNTASGVVDLRGGTLRPHDPGLWMTRRIGIPYVPAARSELWERTVLEVAGGDPQLALFLQMLGGYACTGEVSAQYFVYFYGQGANGKSLLTDLWVEALGGYGPEGYAVRLPIERLTGRSTHSAGEVSPDLLSLRGRRLALCSEPGDEYPLNSEQVKDLTGGDAITGRAPFKMPVTFHPSHTLIGCGNHLPLVHGSDHGFWRRMLVVPFRRKFEPSRRREELLHPGSLQAILAWLIRGAAMFYREGFPIPEVVRLASAGYRGDADLVSVWVDEACEPFDGETETATLFRAFDEWRSTRREPEYSHSRFTRRMERLGYARRKSNGVPRLSGIRLKTRHFRTESPAAQE